MRLIDSGDEKTRKQIREGLERFLSEFSLKPERFESYDIMSRINLCALILEELGDDIGEKRQMLLRWVAKEAKKYDLYGYYIAMRLCRNCDDVAIMHEEYFGLDIAS